MYMAFEKIWLWFFCYIPPMYCINSFSRRGRRIGEGSHFFFRSFLALQDKQTNKQTLGFYNMLIQKDNVEVIKWWKKFLSE